jgi:hypothetical protein
MTETPKFLIVVRQVSDQNKPQQKSLALGDRPWILEWSTAKDLTMTVDFFNLTIGRVRHENGQKRIDEVWRVTHIPGHERKIVYGENMTDTTSTKAKEIQDGLYVVKLTGITSIAEGLRVQSGVGVAIFNIRMSPASGESVTASTAPKETIQTDNGKPVRITNPTLSSLLDLAEDNS